MTVEQFRNTISGHGCLMLTCTRALPPLLQTMTVEQFRNTMAVDKKVQDGKLRLILLK